MNPLLASMFWVCLGLIFLTTVFQGIGLSVQRAFGLRVTMIKDLLTGPWVGFAATLALLQAWHLLLPVNGVELTRFGGRFRYAAFLPAFFTECISSNSIGLL